MAVRVHGRQRLAHLERDGVVVAANELGVRSAKKLAAVADEEDLEVLVQLVQRLPHRSVHLDAQRDLATALAHAVRLRKALVRRARLLDLQRHLVRSQHLEGRAALHRVDVAQLVLLGGVLDGNGGIPVSGHRAYRHREKAGHPGIR